MSEIVSVIVAAGAAADQGAESRVRARVGVAEPTPEAGAEFRVEVERFADVRILRYRVPGFEALDARIKKLIYYLYEAALCGPREAACAVRPAAQRAAGSFPCEAATRSSTSASSIPTSLPRKMLEYAERYAFLPTWN